MSNYQFSRLLGLLSVLCLPFALGCESEQIHTYDAPKMKIAERPGDPTPRSVPAEPTQMLAAILPQGEQTWFFKLTAPPEEAVAVREEFAKFVASTRFENGTPSWEIPADWEEEPGRPMRFTTFRIGLGGPEVSITNLPFPKNRDPIEYELENVNRWRNQLGLPPIDKQAYIERKLPEAAEGEIVSTTTAAGNAILLDLVGEMSPSGGGPPFAGPMMGPAAAAGPVVAEGGSDKPKFTAPDHWKAGELNSFRVAAFVVEQDGETAEITISSAGGDLLSNINRWRGQVDLPPWTIEDLKTKLKLLTIEEEAAGYVQLVGPAKTILGVIHEAAGRTWFIKLTGPNKIASQEQTHFEDFVQSLKF